MEKPNCGANSSGGKRAWSGSGMVWLAGLAGSLNTERTRYSATPLAMKFSMMVVTTSFASA